MTGAGIFQIVSYITASTILVLGIIALFGWFLPPYIPENMRMLLGIMMVLWGVFRIVSTRYRRQQLERRARENEE